MAGTGTGTRTRLLLLQLLLSRKMGMRMRIRPQMKKKMTTPLLDSLPSLTTTGSNNPARSRTHWLIKHVIV
eukprot:3550872-Ditylum_brightwellii.AAC.1